uniref:Uncharacterized protein n=1 Tax=Solanum tuberosum TaxID=4113 RepID=M0ZGH3_SOLTU
MNLKAKQMSFEFLYKLRPNLQCTCSLPCYKMSVVVALVLVGSSFFIRSLHPNRKSSSLILNLIPFSNCKHQIF